MEFSFSALGTPWSILIDQDDFLDQDKKELLVFIERFENRFSRFIPESAANEYRNAKKGTYQVSDDFAELLQVSDTLRTLTRGVFDPTVAIFLEHAGYDPTYRFTPDSKVETFTLPKWSISGNTLHLEGPAVFDFGGIGKGYCIDRVADFLKEKGYQYFLVDAGGDMYGTQKKDGSAFHIALEWPGKPGVAFGTIDVKHAGLAASDTFRRRWPASVKTEQDKNVWHHIVDPIAKKPIQKVVGCSAVAKNAFLADCVTSALFLTSEEKYPDVQEVLKSEFVVFTDDQKVIVSEHWPGELFKEK